MEENRNQRLEDGSISVIDGIKKVVADATTEAQAIGVASRLTPENRKLEVSESSEFVNNLRNTRSFIKNGNKQKHEEEHQSKDSLYNSIVKEER